MDIIEIDKFLTKETCDYCINFLENNRAHWKSFNKRSKIQVKELLNVTGQNHALSIRWGEQGQIPSGQALKILNMENLESRESDIPMFQDFEEERMMNTPAVSDLASLQEQKLRKLIRKTLRQ